MHPAVQRTEDLLEKFSVNQLKKFNNKQDVENMYKTMYDRYYNPKVSTKNKLAVFLQARVEDLANVSKHERVRRNKAEKEKLDYLDEEFKQSPRLKAVETEEEFFE